MANALARVDNEFQPLIPPRGSVAASVGAVLPQSLVGAAFHHLPARELADIDHPVESDVLICSDFPAATETISELVRLIPGCRPLDCGRLSNAAPIESFAAVILQLNVRYKTRSAVRLTGINL
jgi:NADPH-dependent F420 reductase